MAHALEGIADIIDRFHLKPSAPPLCPRAAHALAISKKSVKLHEFTCDQLEPVNVPDPPADFCDATT